MDVDALFDLYDDTIARLGVPPGAPSHLDPRVLLSERQLLRQLAAEESREMGERRNQDTNQPREDSDSERAGEGSEWDRAAVGARANTNHATGVDDGRSSVTLERLDAWAQAGLFHWHRFETVDGPERGVPLVIASRLDLFRTLSARGWRLEELAEYAEWEDWVIEDCLGDERLRYEDDDRLVVGRQLRMELEQIQEEITERLPPAERSAGWKRTSWSSEVTLLSDEALHAKRERLRRSITRIEGLDLASESPEEQHRVGRAAFAVRWWEEFVRISSVERDRAPLHAGFSFAVKFRGPQKLVPDAANLDDFGEIDWEDTLRAWRMLDDPDRWPLRVPGFLLIGGAVQLDRLLAPDVYAERVVRFRLAEYVHLFEEIMGDRRCAHCGQRLRPTADVRRRYCSDECSQAARQRTYRQRQKRAVLLGGREANASQPTLPGAESPQVQATPTRPNR